MKNQKLDKNPFKNYTNKQISDWIIINSRRKGMEKTFMRVMNELLKRNLNFK